MKPAGGLRRERAGEDRHNMREIWGRTTRQRAEPMRRIVVYSRRVVLARVVLARVVLARVVLAHSFSKLGLVRF
jgi:hypothetical protein